MNRRSLNSYYETDTAGAMGYLGKQPCGPALCFHQFHGLFVERDEGVRAEPASLIADNTIGKITAGVQQSQSGFRRRSVLHDVFGIHQAPDRFRDVT